jgi:hypothetical protein
MLELKLTQVLRCLFIFGVMCFITVSTNTASTFNWQSVPGGRAASLEVSGPAKVGFTLMNGEQTGIHFTNTLNDRLVMQNNNFMQGSGVALGDFDGDGWCDVYLCAIDGTNALFRNLGDWRFENVTSRAGLGAAWHSTGAIFADIDADGDLDLLVNSLGQGTHCFRNVGNARFQDVTSEAGVKSQTGSTSLAIADVDGDGDLDLYVANYGTMAILRGTVSCRSWAPMPIVCASLMVNSKKSANRTCSTSTTVKATSKRFPGIPNGSWTSKANPCPLPGIMA